MVQVVYDALMDLNSRNKKLREDAKEFLLSEDAEWYCSAIDFNYSLITNIDFKNFIINEDSNLTTIN
jgi:hypothetical protein